MSDLNKLTIVTCDCGATFLKKNRPKHLTSARHRASMPSTKHDGDVDSKSDKQGSVFFCSWRNNVARKTKHGDRYFERNVKYQICAAFKKHCKRIDSFAVGNEWGMLNPTSIYNRPVGAAAISSQSRCVIRMKDKQTVDEFRNFLQTLDIKQVDQVRLSVSLKDDIKFVTRDDVQAVVQGFDTSLASTRWKAHHYAGEVSGLYKLNWSDAVPSQIPTSERRVFEEYFNNENRQNQLERKRELAMSTKLRWWQKTAVELVQRYDDSRTVWWFFDSVGNTGKTYLGEWFVNLDGVKLENGRSQDIAMVIKDQKYVVFDFTRQTVGHINYSIIENIKNGRVFSSKYHSISKVLENRPTVICFANCMPNTGPNTLSQDRWRIFEIIVNEQNEHKLIRRKP
jgi:hypothetical protein